MQAQRCVTAEGCLTRWKWLLCVLTQALAERVGVTEHFSPTLEFPLRSGSVTCRTFLTYLVSVVLPDTRWHVAVFRCLIYFASSVLRVVRSHGRVSHTTVTPCVFTMAGDPPGPCGQSPSVQKPLHSSAPQGHGALQADPRVPGTVPLLSIDVLLTHVSWPHHNFRYNHDGR